MKKTARIQSNLKNYKQGIFRMIQNIKKLIALINEAIIK